MKKLEQVYEGKAKKVYKTDDPYLHIVDYKDDATAFNGQKRGTIAGKGVINNRVTNHLMGLLEKQGIPTHFVQELSERETLVKKVQMQGARHSEARGVLRMYVERRETRATPQMCLFHQPPTRARPPCGATAPSPRPPSSGSRPGRHPSGAGSGPGS